MYTHLICDIMLCMKLVSWMEVFIEYTVNVHAQELIINNQYLTLLCVYKAAAWASIVHTVMVICTTSFRVLHLMYRPLRVFETTLQQTLHYVHNLNVCHDALHEVSIMEGRFH